MFLIRYTRNDHREPPPTLFFCCNPPLNACHSQVTLANPPKRILSHSVPWGVPSLESPIDRIPPPALRERTRRDVILTIWWPRLGTTFSCLSSIPHHGSVPPFSLDTHSPPRASPSFGKSFPAKALVLYKQGHELPLCAYFRTQTFRPNPPATRICL